MMVSRSAVAVSHVLIERFESVTVFGTSSYVFN